MHWIRNASLQKKIVVLMLILYTPLPLLGWYWYAKSDKAIRHNAIDSSFQLANQVNEHLDTYFTEVQQRLIPILMSEYTTDYLEHPNSDSFDRFRLSRQVEKQLFEPAMLNRDDIYGLSLVNGDGVAVSSFSYLSAERRYAKYKERIGADGQFYVMGLETFGGTPFLSMAITFKSLESGSQSGMLIVDLKLDEIRRITQNARLGKTGYIWMADAEEKTVYTPALNQVETYIPPNYREAMGEQRRGTFTLPAKEGDKLVVFFRSSATGLTVFSEVPLAELNASIVSVSRISIVVSLSLFLLVLFVASAVVYSLSRSLLTLQRLMKRAELGELGVRAPENRSAEIGSLYRGFNKMVGEISRLVEIVHVGEMREKELEVKQKEALLKSMQAQINPHFLYNTLEFINSSAIVEGNGKISSMIVALGDMFRYNVQNPSDRVTLGDEVRHIEAYLSIQAERYERLRYEIDLDMDAARRVPAARSTLQPLIENSFKHGFERHKLRPSSIRVAGRMADGGFLLTVEDGGGGMEAAAMAHYNRLFQLAVEELHAYTDERAASSSASIGLLNVHLRIRLLFGDAYGLWVAESGPNGTRIEVRLPFTAAEGTDAGVRGQAADCGKERSRGA